MKRKVIITYTFLKKRKKSLGTGSRIDFILSFDWTGLLPSCIVVFRFTIITELFCFYLENEAPLSTLTSRKKRGTSNTNSTSSSSKSTRKFLKISSSSSSTPIKQRARKASDRFQLCHLLQTHSKNNDPKDLKTKVWMCAFEPDVNNPGKTTSLVATCGGDSVCFIDCTTGKVLKKYKQIDEEFYCLCWTVLIYRDEIRNEEKKVSILAVAGVTGDIKLIEPHQLVCFEHVSYHKKPVDSLQFHPIVQHWLFSTWLSFIFLLFFLIKISVICVYPCKVILLRDIEA